ncbi:MAG TPA: TauD/TfdA family dioxygenase [Streptosporangiaceae bacterium]|nr:TauD/TfdA family dioxygenase [Streptosporangiaceae bacterium]
MRTEELTDFGLGIRVHDFDPASDAADQMAELHRLLYQHALLLIRGVAMDNDAYADFAARFGPLCEVLPVHRRSAGHPYIEHLTITGDDDNTGWHTDHVEVPGQSPLTTFLCDEAPTEAGETLFCDMRAAIDILPADQRTALEEHEGYYPIRDSISKRLERGMLLRKGWSEAELSKRMAHLRNYTMPLVHRHPISGHRTLVLNEWHMPQVVGMADDESSRLLKTVFTTATSEGNVYKHTWRVGDLLMWDNTMTMHTAVPVGAGRKVHRRIIMNGPF